MAKYKIAKPIIRTEPATYYSSQSKEERAINARRNLSILKDKPMIRVPNKMKIVSRHKKSSGGAGG